MPPKKLSADSYKIGWICPLEVEQIAAMEMLDEEHEPLEQSQTDHNVYHLGSINGHNVVIAGLHQTGSCPAAVVVTQMRMTFRNLRFGLLVGIGGGVPVETDEGLIRLGHVVVSKPSGEHSGAVQYDHGKAVRGHFERTGFLMPPPTVLLNAAQALAVHRARSDEDPVWSNTQRIRTARRRLRRFQFPGIMNDHLYPPHYDHQTAGRSCREGCDPKQCIKRSADEEDESYIVVHRGTIAAGELVMKDAHHRDRLAQQYKVLCFETEAAGVLADFPCMVIRGISDYCDSHKNDAWHGYASTVAAAYARQIFFHMPIEAAQTTEKSSKSPGAWSTKIIVPYPSNPDFVGRHELLKELKAKLCHIQRTSGTSQTRVSLYGLGGVGKTQVALAYLYWLQETCPTVSIFWVHAGSAERFLQSFATIAEEYQIPGHSDPNVDTLSLVKAWLEIKDGRQWLMVLDNADDIQLFFPAPAEGISSSTNSNSVAGFSDYLPECAHGALLVTTRNKQLGVKQSKGQWVVEVGRMYEDESQHLLRNKHIEAEPDDLLSLSGRLEHLPLALVQAAAYIQEMSITLVKYLRLLGDTDEYMVRLLSREFETVGRDSKAPRALAQTWIVSFQQIEQQHPLASDILSFMCFLDRQEIPAAFVSSYIEQKDGTEPQGDVELTEALGALKAFSFIAENKSGSYDMHPLVQLVTRKWVDSRGGTTRFGEEALLVVSRLFPDCGYETRATCRAVLSHANAVLQSRSFESPNGAKARANLLYRMATYQSFEENWNDAEALFVQAWDIRRHLLGESDPFTLNRAHGLAWIYYRQERFEEAERLQVQTLEIRRMELREDHPDTLRTMSDLSLSVGGQMRLEEAETLQVKVLEARKLKLGENHADTLTSMENLALTYNNQRRFEESEKLQLQTLELHKLNLGEDHPRTLLNIDSLATTYLYQGRWEEAEKLQVRALEARKKVLGEEHPHTVQSKNVFASIHGRQGQWQEAEKLYAQVLKYRKEKFGEDHPRTLGTMSNLAATRSAMGKRREAIDLMRECVRLRRAKLGPDHSDTRDSPSDLARWESEAVYTT